MLELINNGDGTGTVTISYTKDFSQLTTFLDYAARKLYMPEMEIPEHGIPTPIEYDTLTNQEKLAVIDEAVKQHLRKAALDYRRSILVNDAAELAYTDPDTQL